MTNQEKVNEFHKKYNITIRTKPIFDPSIQEEIDFRTYILEEEYIEYLQGDNIENHAKEAADMLYVLYGDAAVFGYDLDKVFDLVHKSNMTKDIADNSNYKPHKGEKYKSPDLSYLKEKT